MNSILAELGQDLAIILVAIATIKNARAITHLTKARLDRQQKDDAS